MGELDPGTGARGTGAMPARAKRARREAQRSDSQGLLLAAVERLRAVTRRDRALAWVRRSAGTPYLAAAAYAAEPPREPEADDFEALATLAEPTALDAEDSADALRAVGVRHRCGVAAPVRTPGGELLALLLLGGSEPPSPALQATLAGSAERLAGPLAAAFRLERLDDELRRVERLAALGSLATEIAHEVRNPLVSMKTFLQLLPERRDDPDFLMRFPEVVEEELRRVERLLDRVIEYGRPRSEPDAGPTPLAAALDAVVALLRHPAEKAQVRLEATVEPDTAPVRLGGDALRQVLFNLVSNAVTATPEGGRVELRAAPDAAGVEIRVRDAGPGIDPAERERLFTPFATGRPERPGGLGLAITRRIVEEAGGRIELLDAPEGGAEVRVTLPARSTPPPRDRPRPVPR